MFVKEGKKENTRHGPRGGRRKAVQTCGGGIHHHKAVEVHYKEAQAQQQQQ